jgi:hypothetical protein
MDGIIKKFRNFALNLESFVENNIFIKNNPEAYGWDNILESYCALYDIEILRNLNFVDLDFDEIFENITHFIVEVYVDNSVVDITYYFYDTISGQFETKDFGETYPDDTYIGQIESVQGNFFFEDHVPEDIIDYVDWLKLYNRTNKAFIKMNENENKKEETFIDWLSFKLQKKIGNKIGYGLNGIVYELGDKRIIKLSDIKLVELYKLLNKNIKGFAKIYQIGWIYPPKRFINRESMDEITIDGVDIFMKKSRNPKLGYIIMEKVDTSVSKEIDQLVEVLYELVFSEKGIEKLPEDFRSIIKNYTNTYGYGRQDVLAFIYELVKKNEFKLVEFLKSRYMDILPNIIYELIGVFSSIKDYYPEWADAHTGQFGRNSKGELVAFDVGNDDYDIYSRRMELLPIPKNIIKENKILRFNQIHL